MLVVGIDPHKNSHTAAALDTTTGELLGEITIAATPKGYGDLTDWLQNLAPALVAIENARGLGRHLADHLATQGHTISDVPTKEVRAQRLARRGGRNKNDTADALAAALTAAIGGGYPYTPNETGELANLLTEEREALNTELTANATASTPSSAPSGPAAPPPARARPTSRTSSKASKPPPASSPRPSAWPATSSRNCGASTAPWRPTGSA